MTADFDYISEVDRSIDVLNKAGVILYPTDTIWGLGCDATDEEAVDKIFHIKNRPLNKSCIILFPSLREALKYTAHPPDNIYNLFDEYKSIPTTFIIDNAIGLARGTVNDDDSMAFRVPKHRFCIQLLKKLGKPIVSTSANKSGHQAPSYYQEIHKDIISEVDYIVNPDMPDTSTHSPSKIIRIHKDDSVEVLR